METDHPRTSVREDAGFAASILRREPISENGAVSPDMIAGRRVLVTGAGGFIGTGLARLMAELGAGHLTLLDNAEHALYSVDVEIAEAHPRLSRKAFYCDVRDAVATEHCIVTEQPDFIFHAAALKQLPLVETHVREGFLTNTLGALNVAAAAVTAGAHAVILISSDKAAQPSSALGATKRLAERAFAELDCRGGRTRFSSVRFGNVFASTGSVVPRFRAQIARGGPVTLTDSRMTRFFITRDEACRLVLSALQLTFATGERGELYVLEAGEPLSIAELARRLIEHDAPEKHIPIVTTGAREGERLSEILTRPDERVVATGLAGIIRIASSLPSLPLVRQAILDLAVPAAACDEERLHEGLVHLVPEFTGMLLRHNHRLASSA